MNQLTKLFFFRGLLTEALGGQVIFGVRWRGNRWVSIKGLDPTKKWFVADYKKNWEILFQQYSMDHAGVIHGGWKIWVLMQEKRSLVRNGTSKFAKKRLKWKLFGVKLKEKIPKISFSRGLLIFLS